MVDKIYSTKLQDKMERNVWALLLMLLLVLSIGGIVEIVPLYYLDDTMERGAVKCFTSHSLEYLPPTRARSGPVRFEPH